MVSAITADGDVLAERTAIDAEVDGLTLGDVLARNVERHADEQALSWKEHHGGAWRHLTWREYRDLVVRAAAGLARLGVGRGDHVAIMCRNRPEHLIADLA